MITETLHRELQNIEEADRNITSQIHDKSLSDIEVELYHKEFDNPPFSSPNGIHNQEIDFEDQQNIDPIGVLKAIRRQHGLLTAQEEIELAKRIEKGDLDAKERFIKCNVGLILSKLSLGRGQGLTDSELAQEGFTGLIRATEKFDYRKGFKFSSYAIPWIKNAIGRGAITQGSLIRQPDHIAKQGIKLDKAEKLLTANLGRQPNIYEISEVTGFTDDKVQDLLALRLILIPIDAPSANSDDGETLGSYFIPADISVEDEAIANLDSQTPNDELSEELQLAIGQLTFHPHAQEVIRRYFGLNGDGEWTFEEIAADIKLGLTVKSAKAVYKESLIKLRNQLDRT